MGVIIIHLSAPVAELFTPFVLVSVPEAKVGQLKAMNSSQLFALAY